MKAEYRHKLERLEKQAQADQRYVDLAVRLRVLNEDASLGDYERRPDGNPILIGGRWDRQAGCWVKARTPLNAVEWTIQRQQEDAILRTPSDVIFLGLLAGRQAGKTTAGVMEIVKDAIRWPGRQSAIVSRDFKASRDPETAFRGLLAPHWNVHQNKTDRIYTFPNQHTVVFRSIEAIDSIRGPSLKSVLADEFALWSELDYIAAVGCGAASKDFRFIFATTPRREAIWFRNLVEQWKKSNRSRVYTFRTYDNPRRNEALLEEIKSNTPIDLYKQEFEGELVRPQAATYYLFDAARHVRKRPDTGDYTRQFTLREYGVAADYVAGWDFGREAVVVGKVFRDSHELVVGNRKRMIRTEYLWIVGEAVDDGNTTTEHHAQKVLSRWGPNIVVITDAMGAHDRSEGRGQQDSPGIELLREAGFVCVEPVASQNPAVENRVRNVLRMLHSAKTWPWAPDGETRLYLEPGKAPRLHDALENHKRKHGVPEKDDYHEHPLDALGYLVWSAFRVTEETVDDREDHEVEHGVR